MQLPHPLDVKGAGAAATYFCAHAGKQRAQIHNLRFLGRIFDTGNALGQHGGQQDVFRGAHAGKIQVYTAPAQRSLERDGTGGQGGFRAQGLHTL